MIEAYLFINLDTDQDTATVLDPISDIKEVIFAHRLYGTYDIVLFIRADTPQHLKAVTLESIRKLQFVESTMTMISLDSYNAD